MAGLPEVAVLTVVRDEAVMLPRWLAHYSAQLGGPEHLLVIDDNSTDGSTQDLPCPVVRIPDRNYEGWASVRLRMLNGLAAGLLNVYDAVAFVDADEFLVADPDKYRDLRELLADRPDDDVLGAQALNVVHHVAEEPPLDPDRPVLEQRRLAKFMPIMCKPSLKRIPAPWGAGSHGIRAPFRVDPELYMFHMKFADRGHLVDSSRHRYQLTETSQRGLGSTWRMGDELVQLLDDITRGVDADAVELFGLDEAARDAVVSQEGQLHRTARPGQARTMKRQPLVRIPGRFRHAC